MKAFCSATPVTMPGSAMGKTKRNEIELRPNQVYRATANEIIVPSRSATTVASDATLTDSTKAFRTPSLSKAELHQWVVYESGGHEKIRLELKELISTSSSGM